MQTAVEKLPSLGWYDSIWLGQYFEAKKIIAQVAPHRLKEFEAAMAVFKADPAYEVKYVTGFLDQSKLAEVREIIASIPREHLELHEVRKFGRLIVHDWPPFTQMQEDITGFVSELAGEQLEPRYNFLSLYSRRGICEPHLDTPSAKWTFDLCVSQSDHWPISFTSIIDWPESREELVDDWRAVKSGSSKHTVNTLTLQEGDALLFSGANQWHWRDQIPDNRSRSFCDLLFFHYIPAGTMDLVRAINWPAIFDIPELAQIPGIERDV